jgi:hypothetical protein
MRNLGVRLKVDIGGGEHDPFPVRRGHRLIDAFEFHHVLKRERMLGGLSQERGAKRSKNEKRNEKSKLHVNGNTDVVEAFVPSAYSIKQAADTAASTTLSVRSASATVPTWLK